MNRGDAYFLVLFLINVLQPVTKGNLFEEYKKASSSSDGSPEVQLGSDALKELLKRGLVAESGVILSCTILGNERIAKLGLRKARDKNRLFFLKTALRRDYNEGR